MRKVHMTMSKVSTTEELHRKRIQTGVQIFFKFKEKTESIKIKDMTTVTVTTTKFSITKLAEL